MHVQKMTIREFINQSPEFQRCIEQGSIDLAYQTFMEGDTNHCSRFLFELTELIIRIRKLETMSQMWRHNELDFVPFELFEVQLEAMNRYLGVLEARGCTEKYVAPDNDVRKN